MIFDAMAGCQAEGVAVCDAHPDLEASRVGTLPLFTTYLGAHRSSGSALAKPSTLNITKTLRPVFSSAVTLEKVN